MRQLVTAKLADDAAERVRRSHADAITELQTIIDGLAKVVSSFNTVKVEPTIAVDFFDTVLTPSQLTADTANWNPGALGRRTLVRVNTDRTLNIGGVVGGASGMFLALMNVNSNGGLTPFYMHEDTTTAGGSAASARFHNGGASNMSGNSSGCILYYYDGPSLRWRQIGGTQ